MNGGYFALRVSRCGPPAEDDAPPGCLGPCSYGILAVYTLIRALKVWRVGVEGLGFGIWGSGV